MLCEMHLLNVVLKIRMQFKCPVRYYHIPIRMVEIKTVKILKL